VSSIPASPLVLLVDDYDDARELYAEYLEFHGYRIVTARSGPEALTIAHLPDRPALILMDLRMFGMSGGEAMRILRSEPEFAEVPIVAFTAHALDNEREAALLDGFDAVISKPCLPDELAAFINRYLSHRLSAKA
jgi:two-component system cell cycle response regulator DivK